jgi:hypothetical protein
MDKVAIITGAASGMGLEPLSGSPRPYKTIIYYLSQPQP